MEQYCSGFFSESPQPDGFVTILAVNRFSKMLHLIILKETSNAEDESADSFENLVRLHGLQSRIISDSYTHLQTIF